MTFRIAALDIGDKTVGVALSDELQITAQPYKTLRYKNEGERKKLFVDLAAILREQNVKVIVFGMPINMNGSVGPRAEKTHDFMTAFQNFFLAKEANPDELEWIAWDERLSTSGAERHLIAADVSRGKRKEIIDTSAAVFILQGYLQSMGG